MAQHTALPGRRHALIGWTAVGVLVVVAAIVVLGGLARPPSASGGSGTVAVDGPASVPGELPLSSTYTAVDGAPPDEDAGSGTDGIVVHPIRETPVRDAPAGRPIARMETIFDPRCTSTTNGERARRDDEPRDGSTDDPATAEVPEAPAPEIVEADLPVTG